MICISPSFFQIGSWWTHLCPREQERPTKVMNSSCVCARWHWTSPDHHFPPDACWDTSHVFLPRLTPLTPSGLVFPQFQSLSVHRVHTFEMENSCPPPGFPSIYVAFGRLPAPTGFSCGPPHSAVLTETVTKRRQIRCLWSQVQHLMLDTCVKCVIHTHMHTHTQESPLQISLVTGSLIGRLIANDLCGPSDDLPAPVRDLVGCFKADHHSRLSYSLLLTPS